MGLLEWLGEASDPGALGDVNLGQRGRLKRVRAAVLIRGVVALGVLGWSFWWFVSVRGDDPIPTFALLAVYLVTGYFVHPRPDPSNLGWLGGLVNNPFRWSDDINRMLLLGLLFLLPGRFVAESIVEFALLLVAAGRALS